MNNQLQKESGIKWGPFRLRIPFIHIRFLSGEFIQGLVISGATALAGAPIVMALGLSFEQAVACSLIASTLITSGPIIFGEPLAPGWVTPALPLVIAFFISKGFFDGVYREEAFQYMAAMCIEFTIIIIILGVTGLGKVIVEKIPNALKSGIILGAALAAFYQIFFSDFERYIGNTPVAMTTILIICTITTFSEPFKKLANKNKALKIIGSLGLLPGFILATLGGFLAGEITFDIQMGFILPPIDDVYKLTSPFSIDFPPFAYYLEVLPLVIIGYLLLFGDFVAGTEILKDGQKNRSDEQISIDINRSHNSVGIRNLLGVIINPFFPTQGALWTGVHVVIVERWKQGPNVMKSLFDGIGSYYLMGIPLLFFVLPFITFMKPLILLALGVTLVLTGLACSYVAMSLVKRNSEVAISIITALFIAFGEYNGVAAPWIGLLVGLLLSLLLVDQNFDEEEID
ncbi:MAG: hypothetical protein EVA95_03215 [SAR86 cluster bacterium]|uniref:Xanthine/uracil/vitamin C permease n=1 Tax=SAR86 cluster bacterium TaxID=2030880 RepID=A0A520MWW9_9GAMM|nr:MAG: hypothetical protein EVA95_03215 [SAR86 cluster bacterium]